MLAVESFTVLLQAIAKTACEAPTFGGVCWISIIFFCCAIYSFMAVLAMFSVGKYVRLNLHHVLSHVWSFWFGVKPSQGNSFCLLISLLFTWVYSRMNVLTSHQDGKQEDGNKRCYMVVPWLSKEWTTSGWLPTSHRQSLVLRKPVRIGSLLHVCGWWCCVCCLTILVLVGAILAAQCYIFNPLG